MEWKIFGRVLVLWWLAFCISLTGPLRGAQMLGQTLFCVCLWGYLRMRLAFESIHESNRWPSLMLVGLIPSVEGLNRTKADAPTKKREFLLFDKLWAGTLFLFSCIECHITPLAFLVLRSLEWNYTPSSGSLPAANLGTSQPP